MQAWDALRRPIWLFDPQALRGVYANRAALQLWGAESPDELLSRDFSKMSPAVTARTRRLAQATQAGGEVSERWTFYPNGEPVTVQATISTHRLEDGRSVLLFEASPTEVEAGERRAVEALRHTSTLITLFDSQGGAIFANPAAYESYASSEHPFEARFPDPAEGRRMFAQALAGETLSEVCEVLTPQGRRWRHLDARPVLDPVTGAAGVLLNETDVTQRVEAELARAAAVRKAYLAEVREKFLTEMSHELRTPLNAVIGFSELLRRGDLAPDQAEQAARIHDSGKQLRNVVNEMIRLSELAGWTGDPAAEPRAPAAASQTRVEVAPGESAGRAPRVLYVEDNESNRMLVKAILAGQGIDCQTADDGAQGVEEARSGAWDVILMDIQMPVMNGVEATRAIRLLPDPAGLAPIVALTANTLAEQLETYAEAGMDDVIAKPVDMAELVAKVIAWGQAGRDVADGRSARAAQG